MRLPSAPGKRKTDICLVCQGMNGGVGVSIHDMYKGLKEKKYLVDLVCKNEDLVYLESSVRESDVFAVPSLDYRKGLSSFINYLEANQPDIIITPQIRPTITALRAKGTIKSGTRIYPVVRNTYSLELDRLSFRKKTARKLRLRYYYPKCDGIICVSKGVAEDFIKMTGINQRKVSVLTNPHDIRSIINKAEQPLDHPWFEKDQPPVILGVGRLVWQKNFQLLIEAFEIVRSSTPSRLVILGEGPEREKLEHRIRLSPYTGDIAMPGHVVNPFKYFKRAALFTLSSNYEGLPHVLIEALATGTPVVSTDCPSGPREILMDGEYGPLVPMDSPVELGSAILRTLRNHLPAEALQKRASEFSTRTAVENYLRFFGLTGGI